MQELRVVAERGELLPPAAIELIRAMVDSFRNEEPVALTLSDEADSLIDAFEPELHASGRPRLVARRRLRLIAPTFGVRVAA